VPKPLVGWPDHDAARYRAQGVRRAWARDALQVVGWLSIATPVALWLGEGGLDGAGSLAGVLKVAGIVSGLVATASMVLMLWLTARVPWIDRTIGQDRATSLHARLGQLTFGGLVSHALYLIAAYALADRLNAVAEFWSLWQFGDFALAVVALLLLAAVAVSSVVAARRALPFEAWKVIHLLTYAAVLTGLPHQFTMGNVFAAGPAQWYWIAIWASTLFVMLAFRIFRPLFNSLDHAVVVSAVQHETPDTVTITMTGRRLDDLGAAAGQYFHWRFLAPGLWWHQHPLSLSASPTGSTLRVTVRALGRGTTALLGVRPGTRVFFEGPYGIFSDAARTAPEVIMVGIGIGITPIRAVLEETRFAPGRATVILRASRPEELYLVREIEDLCRTKGARLYTLVGPRGRDAAGHDRWLPAQYPGVRLWDLCPGVASSDVYVCGPDAAADLIVEDAVAAGTPSAQIHHERFSW
jgi:predicted ferric reductase